VTHPTLQYELAAARRRDALEAAVTARLAEQAHRASPGAARLRARLRSARTRLHASRPPGDGAGEGRTAMARVSANENEERHEMKTHCGVPCDELVSTRD
jgi:hypothetical protein